MSIPYKVGSLTSFARTCHENKSVSDSLKWSAHPYPLNRTDSHNNKNQKNSNRQLSICFIIFCVFLCLSLGSWYTKFQVLGLCDTYILGQVQFLYFSLFVDNFLQNQEPIGSNAVTTKFYEFASGNFNHLEMTKKIKKDSLNQMVQYRKNKNKFINLLFLTISSDVF